MSLEATKLQGTLPFTELGLGEMYRQDGYNRTMATDILRDSLKRVFWEHEGESLVFKWLFHPRGKAINTLINELVSQVSGDANTSILRVVALHYRALSLYPEDTELLNARLRHWFSVYLTEWANVISPDFDRYQRS